MENEASQSEISERMLGRSYSPVAPLPPQSQQPSTQRTAPAPIQVQRRQSSEYLYLPRRDTSKTRKDTMLRGSIGPQSVSVKPPEMLEEELKEEKEEKKITAAHYNLLSYEHLVTKKCKILTTRFITIFLIMIPFFWYLFPFNNVNHDFKKKYGFWQDNIDSFTIKYEDATNTWVTLNASNCNVYFYSGKQAKEIRFEVDYPSGAIVRMSNETVLQVFDNVLNNVVTQVRIYLPLAPIAAPNLYVRVESIADDVRRSHLDIIDNRLRPKSEIFTSNLKMQNLRIGAYQAFLNLTHHQIDYLHVEILEVRGQVRDIIGKEVNISGEHGYLYYRAYPSTNATQVNVTQPYGAYCFASRNLKVIEQANCSDFINRNETVQFDQRGHCIRPNGQQCPSCFQSVQIFPTANDTIPISQDIVISLDDGAVIVEQWGDGNPYDVNPPVLQTSTLMRDYFMFSGISQARFPLANSFLSQNSQFDYFTHIETLASQYHTVWVGYVSDLYLQTSASFIDTFSFTILRPNIDTIAVYQIDGKCPPDREPTNQNSPYYNFLVQNALEKHSNSSNGVARARGYDTFTYYQEKLAGQAVEKKISIRNNVWLIVYVLISLILAIIVTAVICYMLWACRTKLEDDARREINMGNRLRLLDAKMKGETLTPQYEAELREKVEIHASLYKYFWYMMSELFLQIIKKEFLNSLTLFFLDIPYNKDSAAFEPVYFDTDKLNILQRRPGLLLKEFQEIYFRYCNFFNLYPCQVSEDLDILHAFGVQLVPKRVPSFRFIRWKTSTEKWLKEERIFNYDSLIEQFLAQECYVSDLQADRIFYRDMIQRFQQFCLTKGRTPEQEYLLPETIQLYADVTFDQYDEVLMLEGVTKIGHLEIAENGHITGLMLQYSHYKIAKPPCKCKTNGLWVVFCARNIRSKEYFLYNIFLTLLHSIPTILLCFVFAVILGIWVNSGGLAQDSLSYICDPEQIFFPWRQTHCSVIPFVTIFFTLIVLAFARYIWLYFVSFTKARLKNIINQEGVAITTLIINYIEMLIFAFFVLVIAIAFLVIMLGAFKNPMSYIAYGTAIFTIIYFIIYESSNIENRIEEIQRYSKEVVQDQLTHMIKEKKQIKRNRMKKQYDDDSVLEVKMQKEFRDALKDDNRWSLKQIQAALSLESEADVEKLAHSLSLDPKILKAVLAKKNKDQDVFLKQVVEICTVMGVDPEVGTFIASLSMAEYNPDAQGVNSVSGEVTKYVRPFIMSRFGDYLNSTKVDSLLALVLECDLRAFMQCPSVLQIPQEVLSYFCSMQREKKNKLQRTVKKLLTVFFPPEICSTAQMFLDMKSKFHRPQEFIKSAENFTRVLKLENPAFVQAAVAVAQNDPWLQRVAITTLIQNIFASPEMMSIQREYEKVKLSVVTLHSLGRGDSYDINRILSLIEKGKKRPGAKILDKTRVVQLSKLIDGNIKMVAPLCQNMGIQAGPVIQDLFAMVWAHKRVPLELTAALDLHFTKGVLLWHFVELNVTGELIKRFIFIQRYSRICQMFKRRFLKAMSYFETLGMLLQEDKNATMTLFSANIIKTAQRQAERIFSVQTHRENPNLVNESSDQFGEQDRRESEQWGVVKQKFKTIEIIKLEKILLDVDKNVLKIFTRKRHRVIRAIAEMIYRIYVLEIKVQGTTKYKGKRRTSIRRTMVGTAVKTQPSVPTLASQFGRSIMQQMEVQELQKWDKILAQFLEINTFDLMLLMDIMRKNVGEIFKEKEKYEVQIQKRSEYDKRNVLFSRALKLQKDQLEKLRTLWNKACRESGGYSPLNQESMQYILDSAESRIISNLADLRRDVINFQPVDLLEFQLQQSQDKEKGSAYLNGGPIARLIRILKNDTQVKQLDPDERNLLSRLMTFMRVPTPDKALLLILELSGNKLDTFIYMFLIVSKTLAHHDRESFVDAQIQALISEIPNRFQLVTEEKNTEDIYFRKISRNRKLSYLLQLFQSNVFVDFSKQHFLISQAQNPQKQPNVPYEEAQQISKKKAKQKRVDSILALVVGTAVRDTDLMRQAYSEILGEDDKGMQIISGLISLLTKNQSQQIHIRKFARHIDADPDTALNLIYLKVKDQRLISSAVQALVWENLSLQKSRIATDIICIHNHVLTDLSHLSKALALEVGSFRSFLSAASGNRQGATKFIRNFKSLANFENSNIVQDFIVLANTSSADSFLNDSKKVVIHRKVKFLTGALFKLQNMSRKLDFFSINQQQLEMALTRVKEWILRKWINTLRAVKGERLLSDTYESLEEDTTSLQYQLDQKVDLLMRALFDDYFCILDFGVGALMLDELQNESKNDIKVEIIRARFAMISDRLDEQIRKRREHSLKNQIPVRKNLNKLSKINRNYKAKPLNKAQQESALSNFLVLCETEAQQQAVRTNCTFNFFQYIPFTQRYYSCVSCSKDSRRYLICESCALLCHNKHELSLENYGKPSMIVCECGKGKFKGKLSINQHNPLKETLPYSRDCFFRAESFQYSSAKQSDELVDEENPALEFIKTMNIRLSIKQEWEQYFMIYDPELDRDISLWENIIYLCRGKCRNSFIAALLADLDKDYSSDKAVALSSIYPPKIPEKRMNESLRSSRLGSENFELVSALMALESGDYFNFSRFSDIFIDIYSLSDSPDYPALLRLTQLLMVIRNPMNMVPNSPQMIGLYEKLLRRLFFNSWKKVVPFHTLVHRAGIFKSRFLQIILNTDAEVAQSVPDDYNQMFYEKLAAHVTQDILMFTPQQQRLLGGLMAVASQQEEGVLALLASGKSDQESSNFYNCEIFINPSLKNCVPLLQTYMRDFKGISKLFTAVYGDIDSIYQLCVINFPRLLVEDCYDKLHYLYSMASRMVNYDYSHLEIYPSKMLAKKLNLLSKTLHFSENASFRQYFQGGPGALAAEALIRVAAQTWKLKHLQEIASYFYIRKKEQKKLLLYSFYAFHGNMYAFGQALQMLAQRVENKGSSLRKVNQVVYNERIPAYYFQLFGFDRDKGNLRKRIRELDEGVNVTQSHIGRNDVRFELSPVREELKERETQAFATEEQEEIEQPMLQEVLESPLQQMIVSILPGRMSQRVNRHSNNMKPLLGTLQKFVKGGDAIQSIRQFANTEDGRQDLQLLEALLSRSNLTLRDMLAHRLLGPGNKIAAANELLDVVSKSSRLGEIKQLLQTFVVEREELIQQREEQKQEQKDPELQPTPSQVQQEEQEDPLGGQDFINFQRRISTEEIDESPPAEEPQLVSRRTQRITKRVEQVVYAPLIPYIVRIKIPVFDQQRKISLTSEKQAFENRAKDVLIGMGVSLEDIKRGFSIDIDLQSDQISVRADKVIQLILNTTEAASCGGKPNYQNVLATEGSLRSCGPNQALLLIALLCIIFMQNRYLLKIFQIMRYVLSFDRTHLLNRLSQIVRLFLIKDDFSAPESELIRKIVAWIRLISALLQKEGATKSSSAIRRDQGEQAEAADGLLNKISSLKRRHSGGSSQNDFEFGSAFELASDQKPLTIPQMEEIIDKKLGFVVKPNQLKLYLQEALAATEQVKSEEFLRTVNVYMGIYYLSKQDARGIGWLARQLHGFNLSKLQSFLRIVDRNEFYEKELKSDKVPQSESKIEQAPLSQERLRQLFIEYDRDKTGTIDFQEFCNVCAYMGINRSREILQNIFVEADVNVNNSIDLSEFMNAVEMLKSRIAVDALRQLSYSSKSMYSYFSMRLVVLLLIQIYLVMGLSLFSKKNDIINLVLNTVLPILVGVMLISFTNMDRVKSNIKAMIKHVFSRWKGTQQSQ